MQYLEILVAEGAQTKSKRFPFLFQKDIDRNAAITFPPPGVGQFNVLPLHFGIDYAAEIVDGGDIGISVLYDAKILYTSIYTQRNKGVSDR
jgi:hypothetical protein